MSNQNPHTSSDRYDQRRHASDRQGGAFDPETGRSPDLNQDALVNQTPSVANGHQPNPAERSYRHGYAQGRVSEQRLQERSLRVRDNDNAARGLLLGVLLTGMVALVVGGVLFITREPQPLPVAPAPADVDGGSQETNNTEIRERVIERTREIIPMPPAAPPAVENSQPAPAPAPADPAPANSAPTDPAPADQGAQEPPADVAQ